MVQTFHEGGGNTPFLSEREYSKEEQMHYRAEPNQQTTDQEQGILSQLRVTGKSTVICGGICASSMGINTPHLPKFLLHRNQGKKNRGCAYPGKVPAWSQNMEGAQVETKDLEGISRSHTSVLALLFTSDTDRDHVLLRILLLRLFQLCRSRTPNILMNKENVRKYIILHEM